MNSQDNIPNWFAWIVDRGVVFWRAILLIAAVALFALAWFINSRLSDIEQNLSYQSPVGDGHIQPTGIPDVIARGQTVFVPVYSHVYHQNGKPFSLTTTLAIHNTDDTQPIVVSSVKYYGTDGKLIRSHLDQPKRVAPLGSIEFLVPEKDIAGGSGAKFLVDWVAEEEIHEPVVQTVMVGTAGGQGLSFVCNGVVLKEMDEPVSEDRP